MAKSMWDRKTVWILGLVLVLILLAIIAIFPVGRFYQPQNINTYLGDVEANPSQYTIIVRENATFVELETASELAGVFGVTQSRFAGEIENFTNKIVITKDPSRTANKIQVMDTNLLITAPLSSVLQNIVNMVKDYQSYDFSYVAVTIDGQQIIPLECNDGTLYGACSSKKPYYCSNGDLLEKASICGCPSGYKVSGDTCVEVGVGVSVMRHIKKSNILVGETATIVLSINVDENDLPSSLGIQEVVPSGLSVVSSNPLYDKMSGNTMEWLFWSQGKPVQDTTITYTVRPKTERTFLFSGNWLLPNDVSGSITGDDSITVGTGPNQCTSDADCVSNQFCEFPVGTCGGTGTCADKPDYCTLQVNPVCGCDENTYSNDCRAAMNGVSIKHTGRCNITTTCSDGTPEGKCSGVNNDGTYGKPYFCSKTTDGVELIKKCSTCGCSGNKKCQTNGSCVLIDNDDDGSPQNEDCNDNDPEMFPGNDESCDGKDNNCDDYIDENLNRTYGTNVGECEPGLKLCVNGAWQVDTPKVGPENESCDGLDNDCDGTADENEDVTCGCTAGNTEACGTDVGICETGNRTCQQNGTWGECQGVVEPQNETCGDDLDNNCDGKIDEGCDTIGSLITEIRSQSPKQFKVVIGQDAAASDSIGAVDSSGIMGITETVMDTQVSANNNLIVVGGPCTSGIAAELLDNPTCPGGEFTEGQGRIQLFQNNGNTQLLIAGYSALDTRRAARAVARYEEFSEVLSGVKAMVTSTGHGLNNIAVQKATGGNGGDGVENLVNLSVAEDAYVAKASPDTSYSYSSIYYDIRTYAYTDDYIRRAYNKFDISSVPAGKTIKTAQFYGYVINSYQRGDDKVSVYHVYDDSWAEDTLTWNNQPCGTNFDNSNNCNLVAEDSKKPPSDCEADCDGGWASFDVTDIIKNEYKNGKNMVSLAFKTTEPLDDNNIGIDWYAKENYEKIPYLLITYE